MIIIPVINRTFVGNQLIDSSEDVIVSEMWVFFFSLFVVYVIAEVSYWVWTVNDVGDLIVSDS